MIIPFVSLTIEYIVIWIRVSTKLSTIYSIECMRINISHVFAVWKNRNWCKCIELAEQPDVWSEWDVIPFNRYHDL